MSDTNILSERKLNVRRLTDAKIYTHAGVLDIVGRRGWGAYLDLKTEAWPAPGCSSTSMPACGCCGSDGYGNCYTCGIWVVTYGGNPPSYSFNTDPTFGYKDGNNMGFKSFALSGDQSYFNSPISTYICTSCAGFTESTVMNGNYNMGYTSYAGIKEADGTLWAWGYNAYGQVGDSTSTSKNSPIQLGSDSWKMVSGGAYYFFAAIRSDGTLWTWGYNQYGQLGTGDTTNRYSPVQVAGTWDYVQCGVWTTAAIRNDGTLWTWGNNANGLLGDNTTTYRSSPVQISGGGTWKTVHIDTSVAHGIKSNGTMYGWGYNAYNTVGDGTSVNRSSPVQIGTSFSDWKFARVAGATYTSYAIRTNGTMYAWGYGPYGLSAASIVSPVQVGSATNHSEFHKGCSANPILRKSPVEGYAGVKFITTDGKINSYSYWNSTQYGIYSGGSARELVIAYNGITTYDYPTAALIKYIEKT